MHALHIELAILALCGHRNSCSVARASASAREPIQHLNRGAKLLETPLVWMRVDGQFEGNKQRAWVFAQA